MRPCMHPGMHACMQLKDVHQRSTHKCDRQLANHAAGARPEQPVPVPRAHRTAREQTTYLNN
jgi:hypothetical protein